jgi:predicted NodU family carbamoyl transferase
MVVISALCRNTNRAAYYHDSASCVLRDGKIVAAGQEEASAARSTMHDFRAMRSSSV